MFLKCELFYSRIETYFPLQLYTEIFEMRLIIVYYSNVCLLKELKVNVNQCVM